MKGRPACRRSGRCPGGRVVARPIREGKLDQPNEFRYVTQLAEVSENTGRGARGLILPASTAQGNGCPPMVHSPQPKSRRARTPSR